MLDESTLTALSCILTICTFFVCRHLL